MGKLTTVLHNACLSELQLPRLTNKFAQYGSTCHHTLRVWRGTNSAKGQNPGANLALPGTALSLAQMGFPSCKPCMMLRRYNLVLQQQYHHGVV